MVMGTGRWGQWVEGNDPVMQIFPIEKRMLKNVRSILKSFESYLALEAFFGYLSQEF
jgi:hypothetical protein